MKKRPKMILRPTLKRMAAIARMRSGSPRTTERIKKYLDELTNPKAQAAQ